MTSDSSEQAGKTISGISLTSFLQLLEQDRKSCTLTVGYGKKEGHFYFHEGQLIDAEYAGIVGVEAAYAILSWDNPQFSVSEEEDRIHRITQSLGHVIFNSTTSKDEEEENNGSGKGDITPGPTAVAARGTSTMDRLIDQLIMIPGVKHYYLLNRQGRMITQSSKNQKIGDFIAYSIVSGLQMREVLEAKGLHHLRIKLGDGNTLLIIPGSGMIIGLLLNENASLNEVFTRLRRALTKK